MADKARMAVFHGAGKPFLALAHGSQAALQQHAIAKRGDQKNFQRDFDIKGHGHGKACV